MITIALDRHSSEVTVVILGQKGVGKTTFISRALVSAQLLFSYCNPPSQGVVTYALPVKAFANWNQVIKVVVWRRSRKQQKFEQQKSMDQ